MKKNIKMVDLKGQYLKINKEIDKAIFDVIDSTSFIKGSEVNKFEKKLSEYLGGVEVITCANGTDALQISLMSLNLKPGDEVIVPSFTYVATAEVIALLNLVPIMIDVDPHTFNINKKNIESVITKKTKAIVPVHLYGQCTDMEEIMLLANKHDLFVIEDSAQAIGAEYYFSNGTSKKAGNIGHIGCTSFFPSKNLGCFGDGGAIFTKDKKLANKIRMIANHGQERKYVHKYIGVNSRLDSIQAAILNIKLKYLDDYCNYRISVAKQYNKLLSSLDEVITPFKAKFSSHVYHQYTLKILDDKRDLLKSYLQKLGVPSMIYYPIPLNKQEAFKKYDKNFSLNETNKLCKSVLSLPIHTELTNQEIIFIATSIKNFFKK